MLVSSDPTHLGSKLLFFYSFFHVFHFWARIDQLIHFSVDIRLFFYFSKLYYKHFYCLLFYITLYVHNKVKVRCLYIIVSIYEVLQMSFNQKLFYTNKYCHFSLYFVQIRQLGLISHRLYK